MPYSERMAASAGTEWLLPSRQSSKHPKRPSRPYRYIKKWQELIPVSSILMQLSTTICVMLLFAHVAACTLVLTAKLEGLPEGSWMVQYGALERVMPCR